MRLTVQEYEDAILGFCSANPKLTIYQAGEVSEPGFSDLDFVVFGDEKPIVPESVKPFLMGGNVIILPRHYAHKINFMERFVLRHLQGEKIAFEEVPSEHMTIVEILEWLPERILKMNRAFESSDPNVLHLLQKSMNRSIDKVSSITKRKYDIVPSKEFRLRLNDQQKRMALVHQLEVARLCWSDFEEFILSEGIAKITNKNSNNSVNISDYYQFVNEYNSLVSYFNLVSNSNQKKMSNELASRVFGISSFEFSKEASDFMTARWDLLCSIYDWFTSKDIKNGMIKYGWLL